MSMKLRSDIKLAFFSSPALATSQNSLRVLLMEYIEKMVGFDSLDVSNITIAVFG